MRRGRAGRGCQFQNRRRPISGLTKRRRFLLDISLNYRPAGETLRRFHLSEAFVRLIMGPLGSGKTTAACMEIYRRACEQAPDSRNVRRTRWVAIRSTYPELETTTMKSWEGIFDERFGRMVHGHPPTHNLSFRLPDKTCVEAEVIFLALDSPDAIKKILGMELTGAFLNEVRDVPKSIVDMLTGRVGRYPAMRDGGPTWHGIIGDTNAPDQDHWYYGLAEETHPEGWEFFRQPGAVFKSGDAWALNLKAENLPNLPPNYYRNQLAAKKDDWIKVYLANDYGFVMEGQPVYQEYFDSVHCQPCDPVSGIDIELGLDFGLTPAAIFGQRLPMGRIQWFDELCAIRMGAKNFGMELKAKIRRDYPGFHVGTITGDPAGEAEAQTDETTVFQILATVGVDAMPAITNDFTVRREAVAQPLSELVDGRPRLLLSPKCIITRKGMAGGYAYRRLRLANEERYQSKPDKNRYSHPCEAGQYLNLGMGEDRSVLESEGQSSDWSKPINYGPSGVV